MELDRSSLHEELIELRNDDPEVLHTIINVILHKAESLSTKQNKKGRIDVHSPCKENGMFIIIDDPSIDLYTHVKETMENYSLPTNKMIGDKLKEVAALRKRQGDNRSCTAHQKAAHLISTHDQPITNREQAQKIKGIGDGIAQKIDEILKTGTLAILEVKSPTDIALESFQKVWGANIVTSRHWFDKGYTTIAQIVEAAETGKITLTKQQNLGIKYYDDFNNVALDRNDMENITGIIRNVVNDISNNTFQTIIVGSYRRGKQSSKDVDILVIGDTNSIHNMSDKIMDTLSSYPDIEFTAPCQGNHQILGAMKVADKTRGFCFKRVDIFIADNSEAGCSLLAHTGPAQYNIRLRKRAMDMGLILNEKCLSDVTGTIIPTHTEADVQQILGFPVLEPKDRK